MLAETIASYSTVTCAQCGAEFMPSHPRQLFCCDDHKRAYHRIEERRGRMLLPLAMASYLTRGGTRGDRETGKRARRDAEHLIRRWKVEDRADKRMDAVAYMARRYRLGFDRP